jgi:transcriptional regulator
MSPLRYLIQCRKRAIYRRNILKAVAHGLGVSRRISQMTKGTYDVGPGSLFPALHRLEQQGWLTSKWGGSENNRKAKFYTITKAGRRQLELERSEWGRITLAITHALEGTS